MFCGKSLPQNDTDVFFKFVVDVRFSNLWASPYSVYQQFLYDTISELREKGLNFQQITDWLNDNDYRIPRGKKFLNVHAHSIVKKKNLRDARFARRYPLIAPAANEIISTLTQDTVYFTSADSDRDRLANLG